VKLNYIWTCRVLQIENPSDKPVLEGWTILFLTAVTCQCGEVFSSTLLTLGCLEVVGPKMG